MRYEYGGFVSCVEADEEFLCIDGPAFVNVVIAFEGPNLNRAYIRCKSSEAPEVGTRAAVVITVEDGRDDG